MRADRKTLIKIEELLEEYEIEVEKTRKSGELKYLSAKTYLYHARNFVRWCKEDFVPGIRKKAS